MSNVNRLRVSNDQNFLFSCGNDGIVAMFEVKDRDYKMRQNQETQKLKFSEEIITDKTAKDLMEQEKNNKQGELTGIRNNNDADVSNTLALKKQSDQIVRLEGDKISNEKQAANKEASLLDNIREAKNNNMIKRKEL